jgi:phosphate transport system permease protein
MQLVLEEQTEIALRYTDKGKAVFFKADNGEIVKQLDIQGIHAPVSSFAASDPNKNLAALGLENGDVVVFQHGFKIQFDGEKRRIESELIYPLGEKALKIHKDGSAVRQLAIEKNENSFLIASATIDGTIHLTRFTKEESMLDDSETWEVQTIALPAIKQIKKIGFNFDISRFYILETNSDINLYDISNFNNPLILQRLHMLPEDVELSTLTFLSGAISFLLADKNGNISQWFYTKDNLVNDSLRKIRQFKLNSGFANKVTAEYYRKGFIAANNQGEITLFHATSQRRLASLRIDTLPLTHLAISPRANALLTQNQNNNLNFLRIENEHPEISWQGSSPPI